MAYFNGGLHGYNGPAGYTAPPPTTAVYCDACGPANIPRFGQTKPADRGPDSHWADHWDTGFKWAPYYGRDRTCDACGEKT